MHAAELVDAALLHVNRTAGREEDFALAMLHFLPAGLPSQIRLSSWTFGVMAIIETHPETITGPWIEGFVLDRHVIKSVPIGYLGEHMQFDTTRSALGELVYQFKNKGGSPDQIIETATAFAAGRWASMLDGVVWPPPSVARARQPAAILAEGVAATLGVPVLEDAVVKTKTQPMKNVPLAERASLLRGAIRVGNSSVTGLRILIVDDLWQTGATMRRVAEVLREMGAAEIRALAMTRTK